MYTHPSRCSIYVCIHQSIPYMQTCVYLPAQMYSHNTGTAQWLGFQVPDRRLQGIAQSLTTHTEVSQPASPESHSIPPPEKVPQGLPAAESELHTPPRSPLPQACPGAGTAHPGSSEWCSQLGYGNKWQVSGSPGDTSPAA